MLHYFVGKVDFFAGGKKILHNESMGVEVTYEGEKTEGVFFLFPFFDQNTSSYKYFAFSDMEKKIFFEQLQKIPGIGSKTAYHISMLPYNELKKAIDDFDINFFQSIQGIGPKTAKRILIELKAAFSTEDISKLNIDEKLYKNILKTLKSFGYEQNKVNNLLKQCPYQLTEDHKDDIIKWLINNL